MQPRPEVVEIRSRPRDRVAAQVADAALVVAEAADAASLIKITSKNGLIYLNSPSIKRKTNGSA